MNKINKIDKQFSTLLSYKHPEIELITDEILNKTFFNMALSKESRGILINNIINLYVQFLENFELQNNIYEKNIDRKTIIGGIVEAVVYLTFEISFKDNKKRQCHVFCDNCFGGCYNAVFHCGILPDKADKANKDETIYIALRILFNPEIDPNDYNINFKKFSENKNFDEFCVRPLWTNYDFEDKQIKTSSKQNSKTKNNSSKTTKQNKIVKTYWQILPSLYNVEEFTDDVIYDYFDTTFNCLIMIHEAGLFYRDWKIDNTMYDYRVIKDDKGKKKIKPFLVLTDIDFINKKSDIISSIRYEGLEKFVNKLGITGKKLEYAIDNLVCLVSFMIYYSWYAEDNEKYFVYISSLEYENNIPNNFKKLIKYLYKINSLIDSSNFTDYIVKHMRTEIVNILHWK